MTCTFKNKKKSEKRIIKKKKKVYKWCIFSTSEICIDKLDKIG